MKHITIGWNSAAGFAAFLMILPIVSSAQSINAQSTTQEQVAEIKKEYQAIRSGLDLHLKRSVRWNAGTSYWNNTDYTGYFNSSNELILLKFTHGEEGYWSNFEYYFKNGEIVFVFIHSGTPDGSEKQERIYFWNKKIIQALIKERPFNEKRELTALENKRDGSIMNHIDEFTQTFLNGVESELKNFYEALNE